MKSIILCAGLISTSFIISGCAPIPSANPLTQRILHKTYSNNYRYPPVRYATRYSLSPERRELMRVAHRSIGIRYKWGGETPQEGFDCSGLMQYAYKRSGIRIPRTAAQQRDASRRISRSQLRPGDMIFFKTGRNSNHVGIYAGRGEFIHASTGSHRVKKERLDTQYWNQHFVKYGAFL